MRLGRRKGLVSLEARNDIRRMQRALATREAEVDRVLNSLKHQFHSLVSTLREVTTLSTEHAATLEEAHLHLNGRLDVLSRIHAAFLLRGEDSADLELLAWDELSAVISPAEAERVDLAGPTVRLTQKQAELFGLMFHELTANAIKFGALGEADGSVQLRWTVSPSPTPVLRLTWIESGADLPSRFPARRGFGLELIESVLPKRLEAKTTLILASDGLRCEVEAPLGAASYIPDADLLVAA